MAGWMMVIHKCFRRAPIRENKLLHFDVVLLLVNNELQQLQAFHSKEQRSTVIDIAKYLMNMQLLTGLDGIQEI